MVMKQDRHEMNCIYLRIYMYIYINTHIYINLNDISYIWNGMNCIYVNVKFKYLDFYVYVKKKFMLRSKSLHI